MSKITSKNDGENSHQNSEKNLINRKTKNIFSKICQAFKNFFASRVFVAILFLLVGALVTNSCNKHKDHKSSYRTHHSFFAEEDDDFFEDDFFAEFETMHKKMEKAMRHHRQMVEKAFEKNNLAENQQITQIKASLNSYEDEKFYNFELQFTGIEPEKINVIIENGYLVFKSLKADIVSTDTQNKDSNIVSQSSNSSSFYYAIFLPTYDEKITPEIIKTPEKINVKLAKRVLNNKQQNSTKKTDQKSFKNMKNDKTNSKN